MYHSASKKETDMKKYIVMLMIAFFALSISGCAEHGKGKYTAPGQVKKETGVNPKSGKIK